MKELCDGVYMLEGDVGGRPLQIMYLRGASASIVLDTGCAHDPERFIVPQMCEAGGDPGRLTWIINTHADLDHIGGNYQMKQLAPQAILTCGDADREHCASPENLMRFRYDGYWADHAMRYEGEARQDILAASGRAQPIEATFRGGEHLRLGPDWEVEVVALPGHFKGHLGILDMRNRALYGADAIQGSVYLSLQGQAAMPPTYLHVDDYLNTVRFIEHLPIEMYVGCHWPVKHGDEVRDFCAETRGFVDRADRLLREYLAEPHTLREACLALGPQLGDWPHGGAIDLELMFALGGHIARLVERGQARAAVRQESPRTLAFVMESRRA